MYTHEECRAAKAREEADREECTPVHVCMPDCAAELCAHECCLSGEGKWDSGVCCCCHSFDANGCADAMCCAFAVSCTWWKYPNISDDNWKTMATPA